MTTYSRTRQDETNKNKITLGNNYGDIDAGEIYSCLGNKSLGNDWGGDEIYNKVCRTKITYLFLG